MQIQMRISPLTGLFFLFSVLAAADCMAERVNVPLDLEPAFIESLVGKLQKHPKRIVFPDGEDERVLKVAAEILGALSCFPRLAPLFTGEELVEHVGTCNLGIGHRLSPCMIVW